MNILLAVDGSNPSLNAVRGFVQRVSWFKSPVSVHVTYVNPAVPDGLVRTFISREVLDAFYREEGEKALAPACALLDQAKVHHSKHLQVGPIAESIVRLAGELACDLIWMGTHGHGTVGTVTLGSIAQKVLHLAAMPVLLVR